MKNAELPRNEIERLAYLKSLNILDTDPESDFDSITQLASHICETPIALVSLVDNDRQWFKSRHGLDATETPRNISFCGHAIHQKEIFEISNSLNDDRFHDNPLVTGDPKVIFYAGAPLSSSNGIKLGTLCVIGHNEKRLTTLQRETLETLAQQVVAQIELRRRNEQLTESFEKIKAQSIEVIKHQKEVVQSAKMASLGVMAAGIAHEINNPLAILLGSSQNLGVISERAGDLQIKKISGVIEKTVLRISKITKGLLSFSRQSDETMSSASLPEVIDETLSFCQGRLKKHDITLTVENLPEDRVHCNTVEVSQVFLNLINNSIDAIESNDNRWIKIYGLKNDSFYQIHIVDSGVIAESTVKDKLFDPFFSTKKVGKGTGLGLSISKGIIENHQGTITLDESDKFTHFIISLPLEMINKKQVS